MRRTLAFTALAAELLTDPGRPRWSYELASRVPITRGSVIEILRRMAARGWLTDHWEDDGAGTGRPRRHYYRLTETGEHELRRLVGAADDRPSVAS